MPIPDQANIGDPGHVQDHNDIVGVLQDHADALDLKAPLASPTFTGTVTLPSTTGIGNVSSTEIGYLDGVTSAIQTQLNDKAALASPTFTGTPTAPTASPGTNTTQIATTAFVQASVSSGGGAYQPLDADLTAISGLVGNSGILKKTAADTWTLDTSTYALSNQTMYIGTTQVSIDRGSSSLTLNGVSIDGNAGTVTDGVYTTGSYSDPSWLTSISESKVLPVQSGNSGKFLTTDSTSTSWVSITKTTVGLSNVENTALSTWAGSSNITTLGTISTGVWSGTNISLNKGGTNASLSAINGGVVYSTGSALAITSAGTAGQVLTSNGSAAPTWQTPSASGTSIYATATIRATWTGNLPPFQDGATGTILTVTLPVGRFTQAPIVSCQEMNITHNSVTGDVYFDVLPYTISTSSVGLWVQNIGPRISVAGGRNITGGVVDIWAVQMTSGSSLG